MEDNKTQAVQLPAFVVSYLQKYGLPNWRAETTGGRYFNNIVVIPAIQEFNNIPRLLSSLCEMDSKYFKESLFLFVVNNSASATEEVKDDNLQTMNFFKNIFHGDKFENILSKKLVDKELNFGFVDASSPGKELPEKDAGVGLARKIGMDLALTLFDYKNNSKKIIICLDADCTVEKNYLSAIVEEVNNRKMQAGYVQYEHGLPENDIEKQAIICYELFLRYYTLGLKYAGSHFAFAYIGSTMLCDAESYCRIGGMNKRKAAEDFYFLEKLAKLTAIQKIDSTKVYPASRSSWRVPFGTGQRITRFLSNSREEYLLYNPKIFSILKQWLEIFDSKQIVNELELLDRAAKIETKLPSFLETNNFAKDWNRILSNSKTSEQIQKQKLMWFDGFRTMKMVHYLRDNGYPQAGMFEAIDELFSLIKIEKSFQRNFTIPDIETQIKYLNILRMIT